MTHLVDSRLASYVTFAGSNGLERFTESGASLTDFVSNYVQQLIVDMLNQDDAPSFQQFFNYELYRHLKIPLRHARHHRGGLEASITRSILRQGQGTEEAGR
jgi:hypothetical protein